MNLFSSLRKYAELGNSIKVGLVGAGKFGTMFLSQVLKVPGIHVVSVIDLSPERAKSNLSLVGWEKDRYSASSIDQAFKHGTTYVGDDWYKMVCFSGIEILIDATGDPISAIERCLEAFKKGKSVINATIEADAFCGTALSSKALEFGVVYSMAYGDQPALACELVDWARTCGFGVVAAGRGHKWQPHFRHSTPDTVWDFWGLTEKQAERGRLNSKMFNSFLDGSKPSIESAAIANAVGLEAPVDGLSFPPGSIDDIPTLMRPLSEGGILEKKGLVEVVSCLTVDGKEIQNDIRKGVWVCFEATSQYVKNCFEEYHVTTDPSGHYMCNFKRWHLIGLELAVSVAWVGIFGKPTGQPRYINADVPAFAKRNLEPGEMLDGEGGFTVFGDIRPAYLSLNKGYLPLGLSANTRVLKPVKKGEPITWNDVECDETSAAYKLRKAIES
mgnify:CR=1 FL=1